MKEVLIVALTISCVSRFTILIISFVCAWMLVELATNQLSTELIPLVIESGQKLAIALFVFGFFTECLDLEIETLKKQI